MSDKQEDIIPGSIWKMNTNKVRIIGFGLKHAIVYESLSSGAIFTRESFKTFLEDYTLVKPKKIVWLVEGNNGSFEVCLTSRWAHYTKANGGNKSIVKVEYEDGQKD